MAAVVSAPPLTWNLIENMALPCADACHQFHSFDEDGGHLDHDRIFTHVHDDNVILDYNYATIKSEMLRGDNLTYKDFINMI